MREIGVRIARLFDEIREEIPTLNRLTFEISSQMSTKEIYGWYHINGVCKSYNSIDELVSVMEQLRRKIRLND